MKSHEEILKRYIKNQKTLKGGTLHTGNEKAYHENELIEWILEED